MSGARKSDPDTSHAAFDSIDTTYLENEVLKVVKTFTDGCIADEVVAALPTLRAHTVIPRFKPLLDKGLIFDTGIRREGGAGRMQRVIAATPDEHVREQLIKNALIAVSEGEHIEFLCGELITIYED